MKTDTLAHRRNRRIRFFNHSRIVHAGTTRLVAEVVKITFHVYAGTIGIKQLERLELITTTGTRQPICQHVPVSMT